MASFFLSRFSMLKVFSTRYVLYFCNSYKFVVLGPRTLSLPFGSLESWILNLEGLTEFEFGLFVLIAVHKQRNADFVYRILPLFLYFCLMTFIIYLNMYNLQSIICFHESLAYAVLESWWKEKEWSAKSERWLNTRKENKRSLYIGIH